MRASRQLIIKHNMLKMVRPALRANESGLVAEVIAHVVKTRYVHLTRILCARSQISIIGASDYRHRFPTARTLSIIRKLLYLYLNFTFYHISVFYLIIF